jgi:NodT family efflux transporter outer membrane factor (OMF) lipoprotein
LDTPWERNPAEINVAEAQAQWEALQEQIMLVRHQLATLTGQAPQALDALQPTLSALRLQALPAQLSADLLGRRPEVVASRWRVEAASQDVAVARTQFYPNLNLSVFAGFNALGLSHLLDAGSQQVGITPALRLPLFDGGRLQAQYAIRQSERDLAVVQYNQAVLDAVRETADAIDTTQSLNKQMQTLASAMQSAQHQYALVQQRFDAGLVNALTVLATHNAVLAQERQYIDLQARQLDNQVQLMKALGGGWQDATATTDQ